MGRLIPPTSLTVDHQTVGFDCGIDSLNEWLVRRTLKNEYGGGSRTYVVCNDKQVMGYYAIAAGSVDHGDAPGRIRRNMPDPIPALILGRLAVDQKCQGAGIGQGLLKDAVARSINVSLQIGARVLIVHALNNKAEAFYLKHGFMVNSAISNTLFLPLL
ncbi:GNAT family N-acetyltransferase [Desulfocicer niacini]